MNLPKRKNFYYFRWQIPIRYRQLIGRREFLRSLHTGDLATARRRSLTFEVAKTITIDLLESHHMHEITDEVLKRIIADIWSHSEDYEKSVLEIRHITDARPRTPEDYCEALTSIAQSFSRFGKLCDSTMLNTSFDAPRNKLRRFAQHQLTEYGYESWHFNHIEEFADTLCDWVVMQANRELANKFGVATNPNPTRQQISTTKEISPPSLREAWQIFEDEKKLTGKWTNEKTIAENRGKLEEAIEILDCGDILITEFDKEAARRVVAGLQQIPAHRKKRFGDTPLAEIPDSAEKISANTVNQRISLLSGFFIWAVTEDLATKNPFEGLQIASKAKHYATYTQQDVKELLNLPPALIRHGWQFWIPRLALYTGARQNELAQLQRKDIYYSSADKCWIISINDTGDGQSLKSIASQRETPIHPKLIENGFIEYLDNLDITNNQSIWPSLTPKGGKLGQRVSEYWQRLKTKHNLPSTPQNAAGESKVFHSFRRFAINEMRNGGMSITTLQALVGHESSMLGETNTYLDPPPVAERMEAIKTIDPLGVSWEHPKKFHP